MGDAVDEGRSGACGGQNRSPPIPAGPGESMGEAQALPRFPGKAEGLSPPWGVGTSPEGGAGPGVR